MLQQSPFSGMQLPTPYSLAMVTGRPDLRINEEKYWKPATTTNGEPLDKAWIINAMKAIEFGD
ncbi:hypothetical protein [Glutamicibacter arilaitensis]|uniref:hypothetical protein n=1 Tax=Glutamicibacter arilaitensis TaxID=256701 RepID=UPI00384FF0C5